MEIYKDLSNPKSKEFEKLLNTQLSKITIEEGKIIEGKINKITEKFVFLFVEGLIFPLSHSGTHLPSAGRLRARPGYDPTTLNQGDSIARRGARLHPPPRDASHTPDHPPRSAGSPPGLRRATRLQ